MPDTDVECGKRDPGAIGLGDPLRQATVQISEVARAGLDAWPRVEAVDNAQAPGRFLGQHHHAANVRLADRLRIPMRFLISDRGDKPPLDAALLLRLVENGGVRRQNGADSLLKNRRVDALDPTRVTEIAVDEPLQRAVSHNPLEE